MKSALLSSITTSPIISQKMGMFAARPVSSCTMRRRLQQRGVTARRLLLRLTLTMQNKERDGDSGAPSDKAGHRNSAMSSFCQFCVQYSDAVNASGDSEDTVCRLLAFDVGIRALHQV